MNYLEKVEYCVAHGFVLANIMVPNLETNLRGSVVLCKKTSLASKIGYLPGGIGTYLIQIEVDWSRYLLPTNLLYLPYVRVQQF